MPQTPSRRTVLRGTLGATGASLLGGCRTEAARELGHSAAPPEPSTRLVPIRVQVNAKPRNLEVDADTSALELVRGQLGLRGSKLACGHGVCGACTMLVDGAPVAACLLPATSLHERSLTTIEGLTGAGGLHPVQRAFMAEDALQCGYCTPGFVVDVRGPRSPRGAHRRRHLPRTRDLEDPRHRCGRRIARGRRADG
jgi:xanthine dehydrogenase YagR molybdenum-binding subunit